MVSRKLIATAQLSEHIVQQKLGLSLTQEWSKLGEASLQVLNVSEEQLEMLYAEAGPVVDETDF
jgi:hypothetical protein